MIDKHYRDKIESVKEILNHADKLLIGGGAGLSASAGLVYSGKRFTDNFGEYIEKYGMTDMYSAGFYPFNTEEEKWAYWSRHVKMNRFDDAALETYINLRELAGDKDYFVISTNADGQFYKAGFESERIFSVQGDYGKIQCAKPCHDELYDNEEMVKKMVWEQRDCKVPTDLVPTCPVCHGRMEMNLRKDTSFVEDSFWHASSQRYQRYIEGINNKRLALMELGVGYNTPGIIKYPFEHMARHSRNAVLIRINLDDPGRSLDNSDKTITFATDINQVLRDIASR